MRVKNHLCIFSRNFAYPLLLFLSVFVISIDSFLSRVEMGGLVEARIACRMTFAMETVWDDMCSMFGDG